MLGAQAVAKAFPEYPTTIVRVTPPAVHLKDYISMAGPEVMAIGRSESAQQTFLVLLHVDVMFVACFSERCLYKDNYYLSSMFMFVNCSGFNSF